MRKGVLGGLSVSEIFQAPEQTELCSFYGLFNVGKLWSWLWRNCQGGCFLISDWADFVPHRFSPELQEASRNTRSGVAWREAGSDLFLWNNLLITQQLLLSELCTSGKLFQSRGRFVCLFLWKAKYSHLNFYQNLFLQSLMFLWSVLSWGAQSGARGPNLALQVI